MINKFEFYHGSVLTELLHGSKKPVSIKLYPTKSNASYTLNNKIGMYIKHSTKRLSPWRFSFAKEHQDEILEMKNSLGEVFLVLVCGTDGVVAISFNELKMVLNEIHEPVEWISASRTKNKEYTIKGTDGSLGHKISRKDFPRKILESIDYCSKNKNNIFTWFD